MQLSKTSNISLLSSHYARTEQNFLVPFAEIKANDWDLSINKYKEIVYEEVKYEAPIKIIEKINSLDTERNLIINSISKYL